MYSIIAVTNKHTAKLHHVGSLYILTYDARNLKHKKLISDYFHESSQVINIYLLRYRTKSIA